MLFLTQDPPHLPNTFTLAEAVKQKENVALA